MRRFDTATMHRITGRGTVAVVPHTDDIEAGDRVQIAGIMFVVTGVETMLLAREHMGLIVRQIPKPRPETIELARTKPEILATSINRETGEDELEAFCRECSGMADVPPSHDEGCTWVAAIEECLDAGVDVGHHYRR